MSEHTPGPWKPCGQWATDKGLAECVEAGKWGIIGAWIDRSNEPTANARLVVAAPDLLAALHRVADCAARDIEEAAASGEPCSIHAKEVYNIAVAAIEKAGG